MKKSICLALASLCALTVVAGDIEGSLPPRKKNASNSIKMHMLRARECNDQNARHSPEIEAQDGKGKSMLYFISKDGYGRQWVTDEEYELLFRNEGYFIEADQVMR